MINFVNGSAANTLRYHGADSAHAGMLRTPESGNRVENAVKLGIRWALDNGCFSKYDTPAIVRMLHRCRGLPGCTFATVPDVVCDHDATLLMFRAWIGTYHALGYPPAFVLQNGVTKRSVPWDSIAAVFIGGNTAFKYTDTLREIVTEARLQNKWVHMGRVNSARRIIYAKSIGCDSFDGTGYSIEPGRISREKHLWSSSVRQMHLWEV